MAQVFSGRMGIALLCILLVCAACASSPPSRFYQLGSLKAGNQPATGGAPRQLITVAVALVQIPDYLDRPQIVTSSGGNELRLAEFDRWAGSLDDDINRALAEDLSALLPADRFLVTTRAAGPAALPQYRVEVNIIRFEGAPGKSVLLKARWTIFNRDRALSLHRESIISRKVRGDTYEALVTAMSDSLAALGGDIAGAILSF